MSNLWHLKNWFQVGHNISWPLSFHTLFGVMYLNKHFRYRFFLNEAERKHRIVLSFLERELAPVIDKYSSISEAKDAEESHRIWTLWWQGEDNAPPLVRKCLSKMRENAGGNELIILTKDNFREYITLPEWIIEKREKGIITFAQLSDIFRFTLLAEHGGLWLDSTIYTSKQIPDDIFRYSFFSQHTKWAETCFVQHNLYHGFSIGSRKGSKLVSFARDMFFEYWKTHDVLVDYLMIDYIIMLAYQHFPDIKAAIDSLPYSSERLYDLVSMLSEPYDEEYFRTLSSECIFSKLDWHRKYRTETKGKPTYYSKVILEDL